MTIAAPQTRIGPVMRLHTATLSSLLWMVPIIGAIFAVILAASIVVGNDTNTTTATPQVVIYIFIYVTAILAITQMAPYALSFGVTRRVFLTATLTFYSIMTAAITVIMAGLASVEHLTNGWGVEMSFFRVIPEVPVSTLIAWLALLLFLTSAATVGFLTGAIFLRWGAAGVWAAVLGLIVVIGVIAIGVLQFGWWEPIRNAVSEAPLEVLLIGGLIGVVAVSTLATTAIFRRTAV
ncbi:hypothetical protein IEU95_05485 [Hoyosella rhizosphaerae]|uniref:Uncharacterized protein n=1 Tax=Hoyosella rhizosphaerae TaxID=1755582 RepID=A0A916XCL2_9ACTN|nr:hypothetical protein [Hoyosella rhizosphaerae]MBN4926272.1 hypothetical protein [Hoyosella rhizosphaerae]GGC60708.1 hypothetical protein GCM10011410_11480 [Hoyosella rhizosphaerae]